MSTLSIKQNFLGWGTFAVSVQPKDLGTFSERLVIIKGFQLTNSFLYYFFIVVSLFWGKMDQIQTTKREYVWIQKPQDTDSNSKLGDLTSEFELLQQDETFTNMQGVWGIYQTYTPKSN